MWLARDALSEVAQQQDVRRRPTEGRPDQEQAGRLAARRWEVEDRVEQLLTKLTAPTVGRPP